MRFHFGGGLTGVINELGACRNRLGATARKSRGIFRSATKMQLHLPNDPVDN